MLTILGLETMVIKLLRARPRTQAKAGILTGGWFTKDAFTGKFDGGGISDVRLEDFNITGTGNNAVGLGCEVFLYS